MFDEGLKIRKILKECEDFFGGFEFVFDIVFVKGRHVVIKSVDIRTLLAHGVVNLLV